MTNPNFAHVITLTTALSLTLSACSDDAEAEGTGSEQMAAAMIAPLTVNDGIDVCFQKIRDKLGDDAKVGTIDTYFSSGREIDRGASAPRGELTVCTVEYQDPDDANAMVQRRYNTKTGTFSAPQKMEIIPIGGDPQDFRVDDFVVPLSEIDTAGLASFLAEQKDELSKAYSDYEVVHVQLVEPGFMKSEHELGVTVEGRLSANNIKDRGSARLGLDGSTVISNDLTP